VKERVSDEQSQARRGRHWTLALLLTLALVRGCLYMTVVPPWQAPDETGHFEYAWLIARLGCLPTSDDLSSGFEQELLASLYEWRYGDFIDRPLPERMPAQMHDLPAQIFAARSRTVIPQRFSLAYLWQALFIWPFRHQDLVFQLYAARFSSVVLNLAVVWLAWCIFHRLVPRAWAVAMTAFVVFLPQHTFINTAVNEGPLTELAACVVLYAWLCVVQDGASVRSIAAVLGGTVIGIWTKKTALFLIPLDLLMLAFLGIARFRGAARSRGLRVLGLLVVLAGSLAAIVSQTAMGREVFTILARWWSTPQFYLENERVSIGRVLWRTLDSFWAQFGWMSVRAGYGWYVAIYLLTVLAFEGWLLPRSNECSASVETKVVMGGALLLAPVVWLTFVVTIPNGLAYYQGRYLFPVVVPIAFYLVGGWARWTPPRFRRYAPLGVVVLLVVLDATVWFLSMWPYFYVR